VSPTAEEGDGNLFGAEAPNYGLTKTMLRQGYGNLFGAEATNYGLTIKMLRQDFANSSPRNPLQQWTIHLIHLT
jgi:hypothetical protein